jgi:4-hydroxybenzoate polyprenyltransferase
MDFSKFSRLIMIEQTLFALPFALIGVLFAGGGTLKIWLWVITALAAARTAGMSFNRAIDAKIDARNPRTKDRLIPKGELRPVEAWTTAIVASVVLIGASFMLNRLCFYLSFPAVFMLFTYSYFKRFSSSSHFYLGLVEAAAPMGGYIAVTGKFTLVPFVLGLIIMTWIAGLDIVYALVERKPPFHTGSLREKEGSCIICDMLHVFHKRDDMCRCSHTYEIAVLDCHLFYRYHIFLPAETCKKGKYCFGNKGFF